MDHARRKLLQISGGVLAATLLPKLARAAIRLGRTRSEDELCALSATGAVALMKSGDLKAEDYATALLARAEKKTALNAFISLNPGQMLESSRAADKLRATGKKPGASHGLPIPVKDSVLTADYPTTAGTKAFGPHARNMKDIVLFDSVITGRTADLKPKSLEGMHIGVPRAYFYEGVASDVSVVVENTLAALEKSGAVLVKADIDNVKSLLDQTFAPILFHESYPTLDAWFKSVGVPGGLAQILKEAGARTQEAFATFLSVIPANA